MERVLGLSLALLFGCAGTDDGGGTDGDTDTDTDVGADPGGADPDVDTYLPSSYPPADPVRLIFLGDSITIGEGASPYSNSYPALLQDNNDGEWPDHGDADLATLYPGITEVYDVSRGGAVTADVNNTQIPDLESQLTLPAAGETIVVMTIGGNDAQGALNPFADPDAIRDTALANFEDTVAWFQDPANFPDGAYIYATNVYEPSDGVGQVDACFFGFDYTAQLPTLDEVNDGMYDLAVDLGFSSVDMHGHFLGHGFNNKDATNVNYHPNDHTRWLDDDCIHPNNRGHHEIRRLFHAAIGGWDLPLE